MVYYTKRYVPENKQVTWVDVLLNFDDAKLFKENTNNRTTTRKYENVPKNLSGLLIPKEIVRTLKAFNERHADLFEAERSSLYRSYKIRKRSGGLRQIDEPLPALKDAHSELKDILSTFGIFHHASAYAYIEKRCTVDCLKVHRNFGSEYYLKTDLSDFFGSTTEEFVQNQVKMIFPFSEICKYTAKETDGSILDGKAELFKALSLCFLNGGLPQGTTISPFLTNLIMIPIDFELSNKLSERKLVYTRYADDMLISGKEKFPWQTIVALVQNEFKEFAAPYHIKDEKTRFGSRRGSNFNLGLCTNAQNQITVGHKAKKIFKAMLNSYILDTRNKKDWPLDDVQHLSGLLSYYMSIEPVYFNDMINRYNEKYNVDFKKMLKKSLSIQ